MQANIKKLYLANFLTGFTFWYSIEKLFMQSIGIDAFGVGLNAVVLIVFILLFDVPSGVLADKWNRKYTLMIAVLSLGVASAIQGLSNGLPLYILGTLFYGIYMVFTSGTYQAIMYDTLKELGIEQKYDRYQGRAYALFLTAIGISATMSGHIVNLTSYRGVFFFSIITSLLAFLALATLTEPKLHRHQHDAKLWPHIKSSIAHLTSDQVLIHVSMFIIVGGLLRNSQNEFSGLYYIALGFGAVATGYVNAIKWIVGAIGQHFAERVGHKVFLLTPVMMISFTLFSLIQASYGLLFFYLAVLCYGLIQNQSEARIQSATPSHIRATTLSVVGFATNLLLVPLGLLFGYITKEANVYVAYQMLAFIGMSYLILWLVKSRKVFL